MKNNVPDIEVLFGLAEECGTTSIELYKHQAIEKIAKIFSALASSVVITMLMALFTICLNIGLAIWFGELLGKMYYGFFIIAGFYLIVSVIVILYKKLWIEDLVRDTIIDKLMEKEMEWKTKITV